MYNTLIPKFIYIYINVSKKGRRMIKKGSHKQYATLRALAIA